VEGRAPGHVVLPTAAAVDSSTALAPSWPGLSMPLLPTQGGCRLSNPASRNVTDLLTRIVNGWPQKHIAELMPWFWAPPQQPP
jgi:hypothetical protein